jgi:hypothetical protein
MTDFTSDGFTGDGRPAPSALEPLGEAECWELLGGGDGIGRVGYTGRFGPMIPARPDR